MSKFKLTQTATEVQDILNNSLQKPTGLSKTKLVGVGVNGQENIEIGDNLTLANGKLSATGGGGGGNTLYAHYIRLRNGNANLLFSYISSKAEEYTVATLKADLKTTTGVKRIVCNGYYDSKPTQYITVDGDSFVIAVLDNNGTITRNTVPTFSSIQDYVEAI